MQSFAAATSSAFILANSVAGLSGMVATDQLMVDESLFGPFALAVVAGGLVGARLGSAVVSETTIRRLLAGVLVVAAGRRVLGLFL